MHTPTQIIHATLAACVRRRRRRVAARAIAWGVVFVSLWFVVVGIIDRAWALPSTWRVTLLCILTGAVGARIGMIVARHRRPWDAIAAAAAWEAEDDRLRDRLTTVVTQQALPSAQRGSAAMTARLEREVAAVLADQPPRRAASVPLRGALAAALACVVGLIALASVPAVGLPTFLARQVMPFADVPPVTSTRINVLDRARSVARGAAVTISADITRPDGPAELLLLYDRDGPAEIAEMTATGGARFDCTFVAARDATFRVRCGDAVSPAYELRVVAPLPPSAATRPADAGNAADAMLRSYRKSIEAVRRRD